VVVIGLIKNVNDTINALYVFLITVAFGLFLYFCVRPLLVLMIRKSSNPVSQFNLSIIFTLIILSSWFTQAIGVHSIFGAFLVGLITPHEEGFAIKITEKLEDLVTILFLPIYFAYSGINTELGVLNDGTAWGLVVLVISTACIGKIVGCGVAAKLSGLNMRESATVGLLMNAKGLVELIVLNIGLQEGIIDQRIFSIFVIMALFTTFITVPLVAFVYPFKYYLNHDKSENKSIKEKDEPAKSSFMVCLTDMRCVPSMMNMTQLLSSQANAKVHALRLIEMGNRMSSIMQATDGETIHQDPVMNVFRTYGHLQRQNVTTSIDFADHSAFSAVIMSHMENIDFCIVPADASMNYSHLYSLLAKSAVPVCVFLDRGFGVSSSQVLQFSEMTLPGHNQRIIYVCEGTPNEADVLFILTCMAGPGLQVEVLMTQDRDVVSQSMNKQVVQPEEIQARLNKCTNKDLVIVEWDSEYKDWANSAKPSVMIVHSPSSPSIIMNSKKASGSVLMAKQASSKSIEHATARNSQVPADTA
jgi:hypothetical protein